METLLDLTQLELEPFKIGAVVIPVLRSDQKKNGKVYEGFRYKINLGGMEYECRRTSLEELKKQAVELVKQFNTGKLNAKETIVLNYDDSERWRKFRELEELFGQSLINFFTEEVEPALKALAPFKISLLRVIRDYAIRHTGCRPITVSGAIKLFLREKEFGSLDTKPISIAQVHRYRAILGYLSDKYGHKQITELTPVRVQAFLRGLHRQKRLKARLRTAQKQQTKGA